MKNKIKKTTACISALLVVFSLFLTAAPTVNAAQTETAATFAELQSAMANVYSGGTINITADIEVTGALPVTTDMVITSDGGAFSLIRADAYNGAVFDIGEGCLLTVQNLTIDGNAKADSNQDSLVYNSGHFILGNGGVLRNSTFYSPRYGGAAVTNAGEFTMNAGSLITNCISSYAAAVYCEEATFIMNGGSITNCEGSTAGAVFVDRSTVNILGGTFSGNMNRYSGGAEPMAIATNSTIDIGGAASFGTDIIHLKDGASLGLRSALTSAVNVKIMSLPPNGVVVAQGTGGYTATESDRSYINAVNAQVLLNSENKIITSGMPAPLIARILAYPNTFYSQGDTRIIIEGAYLPAGLVVKAYIGTELTAIEGAVTGIGIGGRQF